MWSSKLPILRVILFLNTQLHATVMNARHRKRYTFKFNFSSIHSSFPVLSGFFQMWISLNNFDLLDFLLSLLISMPPQCCRNKRKKKSDSFDAREILKQYGSKEWGVYHIREAHLSQRFAFDETGYYHCCASIPFPEHMQLDWLPKLQVETMQPESFNLFCGLICL